MFRGELPTVGQPRDAASWTPCLHLHFINQIRTITHRVSSMFMNNNQSECLCVAPGNGWISFQRTLLCRSPWMTCYFAYPITRLFIIIMVVARIRAWEDTLGLWRHHLLLIAHLSQSLLTSRLHSDMSHTVQIKRWGWARHHRAQTVMNESNAAGRALSFKGWLIGKAFLPDYKGYPRSFYEGLMFCFCFFSTCTSCADCISPILEKRACYLISPRLLFLSFCCNPKFQGLVFNDWFLRSPKGENIHICPRMASFHQMLRTAWWWWWWWWWRGWWHFHSYDALLTYNPFWFSPKNAFLKKVLETEVRRPYAAFPK